jgi:succinate dehydrogenase/fumarate reductase flavoprotein subunit
VALNGRVKIGTYVAGDDRLRSSSLLRSQLFGRRENDHALRALRDRNALEIVAVQLIRSDKLSKGTVGSSNAIGMSDFELVG